MSGRRRSPGGVSRRSRRRLRSASCAPDHDLQQVGGSTDLPRPSPDRAEEHAGRIVRATSERSAFDFHICCSQIQASSPGAEAGAVIGYAVLLQSASKLVSVGDGSIQTDPSPSLSRSLQQYERQPQSEQPTHDDHAHRIGAIVALRYSEWLPDRGSHGAIRWRRDEDKLGREWLAPLPRPSYPTSSEPAGTHSGAGERRSGRTCRTLSYETAGTPWTRGVPAMGPAMGPAGLEPATYRL